MYPDREDDSSLTRRGRLGSQGVLGFYMPAFQREKICLCDGCFHWKKLGADVCVRDREAAGEDLEPTAHRVGSTSVPSRSVHTAPRNYPRKPDEKRKRKRKWTLLCTGETLIFLRVSMTGCVLNKWDPGTGVRPGAEINGSTSRATRWCSASVLRLWDARACTCSSRRSRSPHRELRGRDEVERLGPPFILSGILDGQPRSTQWLAPMARHRDPPFRWRSWFEEGTEPRLDPPKSRWKMLK